MRTTETESASQNQFAQGRKYSALIVGDSTTRILSSNKLCGNELKVRMKSHPGGRLHDVCNSIIHMAESDDEFICTTDAIVIHCGTNNLSDGDSAEKAAEEMVQFAEKVKHVNSHSNALENVTRSLIG